jgi:HAD superfamily hydrolase (TIGR01549 family)
MNGQAITFDFHNTLAACPEWFELEVKTLPSVFLQWWSAHRGRVIPTANFADADGRYRELRRDIMEHGNELTAEACLAEVFAQMRLHVPGDDIQSGVARVMREALAGASPIPGAVETVRELYETGVPIGVVSSAVYHPFLEWTLEAFGVRDALQVVITSASAGFYKSRPEIFLHAADALAADPSHTVHIGDSLRYDVGGASRVGMGTVWLRRDDARHAEDSYVPDLTLETLESSAPRILDVLRSRRSESERNV